MVNNIKKYRFFYHYRRSDKKMSVHFRKQCIPVNNIECQVTSETKRNKVQPYLVLQGYCSEVIIEGDKAIIK